ncbi:hypothetical protein Tco_1343849 [Tanacetum coccineum]
MVYQLTKFYVQRVDMVLNPPWNLPFLGAKGLTSPEQTATGKGISNPLMAVMVCQKPYGIQLTNVSSTERVNTPGSDENRLKLYDLMYKNVKVADTMVKDVLPSTTQEEQFADEKERKARTLLLMAVPKDHLKRFHGMDDAKEIWAAIKTRRGLEKGYDRFQKLLSQLDALGAWVVLSLKVQREGSSIGEQTISEETKSCLRAFSVTLRQNWNQRMNSLKSKRVVHTNDSQATPAWNNTNRINKANQFNPRPVNVRPNLSTASNTFKTGRVNVNTGKQNVSSGNKHVNSGSVHVNSGTQFKSGASRFNTGKQHVNSGSVHVNSGTQFKSGASRFNTGKQHVNSGRMYVNSGTQNKSGGSRVNTGKQNVNSGRVHVNTARVNRPVLSNQTSQVNLKSPKKCFSKQSSPVNRPFSRHTAYKSNIYAVKGKMGTAVKTSAGCVWRKAIPLSNINSGPTPDSNVNDHPLKHMEHRGIFDSGCSGHMTGNRAHLEDYQELSKVGSVTFGGSKGSISGKGTIRLGNLVFDDVAFVKELGHFNLFSISQICDKKLNVLFTEKECFVVSSDFKMPDENQGGLGIGASRNPIRNLGDCSRPSHEGYRNTIELPDGNNVVPLRSDTIRLVQNRCSFHGLRSEDSNQRLKAIDYAAGGRLGKTSIEKAWNTIEELAQYEEEGWNDIIFLKEGSVNYENANIEQIMGIMKS